MVAKVKQFVLKVLAAEPVAVATALESLVAALAVVFNQLDVNQALSIVAALGSIQALLRSAVFSPKTVALKYTENVVGE